MSPTILPSPCPTVTVLSQKGGTGKTTMVRSLADVLRRVGLDVLAVDLDPQGNLSDYFDVDPDATPTIGEVLAGRARAVDAIHKNMIPANLGLAEAELVLSGKMGRELTLKRALRESRRQHDLILIDCPPALGLLSVNALVAASHALVSAEGEYFSLQGVEQVLEVMQLARDNLNEGLEWLGVVLNMADMRMVHTRETLAHMRESFGDKVFTTVIRRSVRYPDRRSAECRSSTTARSSAPTTCASPTSSLRGSATRSRASGCVRCARRWSPSRTCLSAPPTPRRNLAVGRALRHPRQGRADHRRLAWDRSRRGAAARKARSAGVARRVSSPSCCVRWPSGIGDRAAWFEADVTDVGALNRAVDATVERFGGIDVVIANAGVAPFGTVATIDPVAFERTIEVNLIGVWRTVRAALPHVVARQGYILTIASLAAALHPPMLAHYAATKAGVEAFSDSLRAELAHTGTRVGVAYFSFIDTDMTRDGLESPAAHVMRDATPGPFSKTAPLRRRARRSSVASAAAPTRCGHRAGCCR